ncbi:MAG: hypothetical protein ABI769_19520 [Pseudomonadota bacterium]
MARLWTTFAACLAFLAQAQAAMKPRHARYTIAYSTFAPLNTGVFIANGDGSNARLLVTNPAFDSNPTLSPDGRWVLFTSRRNGSPDIYRVRVDGTHLERLTDDVAFDDQAVMSPDGKRVAFVSSRSGQADIWLLELKTRKLRNLTNRDGGDYRPAWSPEGEWLAFTSDRDSDGSLAHTGLNFAPLQRTQLYVIRADGSQLKRLTDAEDCVGGASWSPDGKTIAFFQAARGDWHVMSRPFPAGGVVESQIVTKEVATGVRTTVTSGPGRKLAPQWLGTKRIAWAESDTEEAAEPTSRLLDYWSEGIHFSDGSAAIGGIFASPHWSTDGRSMVFHRFVEEAAPTLSSTFSRDPMFRLVRTGAFPSFAPDGRFAYTTSGARLAGTSQHPVALRTHTQMWIAAANGANPRLLYSDAAGDAIGPSWSPAGDRIAFGIGPVQVRPGKYGPAQIALINPDGSGFRRLTPDDGDNYQFASFSPDGKQLVARAAQPTSKGLVIIDVDSGKVTPLTPEGGRDNLPMWSPKGDAISFTSNRDGDWEIYRLKPDGTEITRLTNSSGNDAHAAWSPDGEWLVFGSARGGFKDEMARGGGGQGATDIFVMRADGSDVRRLTDDAAEEGTAVFAWK